MLACLMKHAKADIALRPSLAGERFVPFQFSLNYTTETQRSYSFGMLSSTHGFGFCVSKTRVEIDCSHYDLQNLCLNLANELSSALPLFWHLSCQSQAGRFPRSTCSYCKLLSCHCSLLSAPTRWASMGADVALLLELALPWTSLTVKATRAFCAKYRCQPRFPARVFLHFVSAPIPLLSGYSSWRFISVIDRGGEKWKKNHKIKPLQSPADMQQTTWALPDSQCVSTSTF